MNRIKKDLKKNIENSFNKSVENFFKARRNKLFDKEYIFYCHEKAYEEQERYTILFKILYGTEPTYYPVNYAKCIIYKSLIEAHYYCLACPDAYIPDNHSKYFRYYQPSYPTPHIDDWEYEHKRIINFYSKELLKSILNKNQKDITFYDIRDEQFIMNEFGIKKEKV